MIIDHGPFPVFRCKCGKEVWGVNYDRMVVCGCGSIMRCVNYSAGGALISASEGDAKNDEEPSGKGPSIGCVIHQSAQALVSRKCLLM